MDSFLSHKRRKLSLTEDVEIRAKAEEDDSTDFKLAMLASLHPQLQHEVLLDTLLSHEGSVEAASASLLRLHSYFPKKISKVPGYQSCLASFAASSDAPKRAKILAKKGKTLYLYSPEDIAAHTPCSIIHNFLPVQDANALLEELLEESHSFEKITFKMFDNVVTSPHTSCLYVDRGEDETRHKTEYLYNGDVLTVG